MLQIRRLLQLLEKGTSKRKIARLLGSGCHTVDNYVARIPGSGLDISSLLVLSDTALSALLYPCKAEEKADPGQEDLLSRWKEYEKELRKTGVTKHLLWQEYRQEVAMATGICSSVSTLKQCKEKRGNDKSQRTGGT